MIPWSVTSGPHLYSIDNSYTSWRTGGKTQGLLRTVKVTRPNPNRHYAFGLRNYWHINLDSQEYPRMKAQYRRGIRTLRLKLDLGTAEENSGTEMGTNENGGANVNA